MRGFFITGTGTEIGKTIVTAALTFGIKQMGLSCIPVKPIGAGGINIDGRNRSEDALIYRQTAQLTEPLDVLNPYCLQHPASPHYAAVLEDTEIPIPQIVKQIQQQSTQYDITLVEGVGGWLVPLNQELLVRDFAQRLGLPVIVVCANILGAINHTLLTIESIRSSGQTPAGVIFTYPGAGERTGIQQNNMQTIKEYGNTDILGEIPYLNDKLLSGKQPEQLWQAIKDRIQWNTLMNFPGIPPNK